MWWEKRSRRGVVGNVLNCDIVVSEIKTLQKGMNPLIPPNYGLGSTTTVDDVGIK